MNTSQIISLVLDANENLYIGGEFDLVGGINQRNNIAKFNSVGNLMNFNPIMNGPVYALAIDANGKLLAGGGFFEVNGISRNRLAQFDTAGVLTSFKASVDDILLALAFDVSGNLHVGGYFSSKYAYFELCNTLDMSITDNSPTLTSNAFGASYQWLDCNNGNSPILGETNQSFTATVNGSYAVEVTRNGCVDTSLCFMVNPVGIENKQLNSHNLNIHPNPSNGVFVVDHNYKAPIQIEVMSITGQIILKSELTENSNVINLSNQPAGMYFINVFFGNSLRNTRKVIVN